MSLMSRCRTAVQATTVICLLLGASAAQAQDVPFAFLIVNGWQAFYAGPAVRIDQAMTSWYALGQIHAITNTQKGAEIGTANLQVFSRTVPDPTFATLGPLAGLISLNLGTLRGHLAVFETPAGLRSTVAILDSSGTTDLRVSGTWAIGDGSAVGGGSPNDMVVGGIAHFGTPLPAGNVAVTLGPYFPLVPFVNDQSFSVRASGSPLPWQVGAGSSYHNSTWTGPSGPTCEAMRAGSSTISRVRSQCCTPVATTTWCSPAVGTRSCPRSARHRPCRPAPCQASVPRCRD